MSGNDERLKQQEAAPEVPENFLPADKVATDPDVVGLPAVVTIRIPGRTQPGEIRLHVRGTFEYLIAYAVEPLEVGRHVEVVTSRGARAVDVRPTTRGT